MRRHGFQLGGAGLERAGPSEGVRPPFRLFLRIRERLINKGESVRSAVQALFTYLRQAKDTAHAERDSGGEGRNRTYPPTRSVGATVLKTVTTTRHASLSSVSNLAIIRPIAAE